MNKNTFSFETKCRDHCEKLVCKLRERKHKIDFKCGIVKRNGACTYELHSTVKLTGLKDAVMSLGIEDTDKRFIINSIAECGLQLRGIIERIGNETA